MSVVLVRGIYYITSDHYSLSEKLVMALIVTGECRAETIADNMITIAKNRFAMHTCVAYEIYLL